MEHVHIKQFESISNAYKVLRYARNLVDRGWCRKHAFIVHEGRKIARCSSQAMSDAAYDLNADWFEAEQFFKNAIGMHDIPGWNDRDERTKSEVLAAFDKAMSVAVVSNLIKQSHCDLL